VKRPRRLRRSALALVGLIAAVIAMPVLACETIHFKRGTYSATVRGVAPADDLVCYQMATGPSQQMSLRLSGRNVIFSVDNVIEGQNEYSFITEKRTYRISVSQLMRSMTDQPFTLFVSVR